jgi:hypothetical protein
MQDVAPPPSLRRRIGRTERLFQYALKAGFDHLIKGDVIIKKLKKKHQYKIIFSKVYGDRFLFYQVFNKDNTDSVNDQRFAAYIPIKNIVKLYNDINYINKLFIKPLFTPTTIMELPNFSKYAFVINNVYFNSHKRLVFIVSTKEINLQNNTSKKLTQIPSGKIKHVRFDIDNYNYDQLVYNAKMSFIVDDCFPDSSPPTINVIWNAFNAICDNPDFTIEQKKDYCPISPLSPSCGNDLFFSMSDSCFDEFKKLQKNNKIPFIINDALLGSGLHSMLKDCVEFFGPPEDDDDDDDRRATPPKVTISNDNINYTVSYVTKDNILWNTLTNGDPNGDPPEGSFMVYTFYANKDNGSTDITINDLRYTKAPIHFLCIGGGAGAAASNNSGGGGAGGFRTSYPTSTGKSGGGANYEKTIYFEAYQTYRITVGNGSNGIVGDGRKAKKYPYGAPVGYDLYTPETVKQGFPSSIIGDGVNIISYGGSPGCCNKPSASKPDDYINKYDTDDTDNQQIAGCGGGSTDANFGTGSQGYDGGKGSDDGSIGGGGGGAGSKGVDGGADKSIAGNGGDGIGSDISGTYTLYAGGGSGSSSQPNYPLKIGAEGRSNTGSGGGAGCKGSTDNPPGEYGLAYGGDGGSGIVILRIPLCSEYIKRP